MVLCCVCNSWGSSDAGQAQLRVIKVVKVESKSLTAEIKFDLPPHLMMSSVVKRYCSKLSSVLGTELW